MKATCRFFGKCSGCSLQQFPYVKQLHDKTRKVRTEFARFVPSGLELESVIHPIVPSPKEFAYRSSSKLCLNEDEFGRRSIGLYARGSKKVIDIPGCPIHEPAINKLIERLFAAHIAPPAPFYQHGKRGFQVGRLKFLTVRYSPESSSFGLVLSHTGVPRADLLTWASRHKLTDICLFESTLTKDDEDLVISRNVQHLAGQETFTFSLDGRLYQLDPMAFFQANHSLTSAFIEHITKDLSGKSLLDLYGGFGSYSLAAAKNFDKIHLVEANPCAIDAANTTIKSTGLQNIQTSAASVEDILKKLLKSSEGKDISHIIVNPPRGGLSSQAVQALCQGSFKQLKRLHYVSCNMETLKRDLAILIAQGGFQVETITPFDMFPQTEHIELVVKLIWVEKAKQARVTMIPHRISSHPRTKIKSKIIPATKN